jgi:hypothetical protein
MKNGIDNFIFFSDVEGKVISAYHLIDLQTLLLLDLVQGSKEEEFVDSLLDVALLGLIRGVI